MRISGQSIVAGVFPQNLQNGKDPVVFQGLNAGGAEGAFGYAVPNLLIDHAMRNPHVPPGFWRGVNLNHNAIYVESFIDEVAQATKQDPLALRRKLLAKSPKHLAVLNAVAARVGWDKPAPAGVGRGLAQIMGFGSYVAACAEVSVADDGTLEDPAHRRRHRPGPCRQSAADRGAGRGLVRVRPVGRAVRRLHGEGRPHRAGQLQHLPGAADERRCRRSRRS